MATIWRHLTDPLAQLCAWTMIAALALPCLVAIWAALSTRHWLWRVLAVWTVVMLTVPVRAWELTWTFTLAAVFIVAAVQLGRAVERRRLARAAGDGRFSAVRYRFSLRDLLLIVFSICLWLPGLVAAARHVPRAGWPTIGAFAAVLAGVSVIAAKLAFGPRRARAAVMLAIALPLAAYVIVRRVAAWTIWMFTGGNEGFWQLLLALTIAELQFVVLVSGIIALVQGWRAAGNAPARRATCAGGLTLIAGVSLACLGYLYVGLFELPPSVSRFELAGNQYPRILEVANRMFVANPRNIPVANLRSASSSSQLAGEMAALFDEVLPLLAGDNAVAYDPAADPSPDYFGANVQVMRGLCRALRAESEAAMVSGQSDVAADYALACVGLSQSMGRGGLAVDALVAAAINGIGYAQLAKVRSGLSIEELHKALATLARDAERHDDIALIRARETDYDNRTRGFTARLERVYVQIAGRKVPWEQALREYGRRRRAENALLQIHLAAQLFAAEHGRQPAPLDELVPDYLPSLPLDPYTNWPLLCKTKGGKLILYSVGRDGVDNGGQFTNSATYHSQDGYDFDLDTLIR